MIISLFLSIPDFVYNANKGFVGYIQAGKMHYTALGNYVFGILVSLNDLLKLTNLISLCANPSFDECNFDDARPAEGSRIPHTWPRIPSEALYRPPRRIGRAEAHSIMFGFVVGQKYNRSQLKRTKKIIKRWESEFVSLLIIFILLALKWTKRWLTYFESLYRKNKIFIIACSHIRTTYW